MSLRSVCVLQMLVMSTCVMCVHYSVVKEYVTHVCVCVCVLYSRYASLSTTTIKDEQLKVCVCVEAGVI